MDSASARSLARIARELPFAVDDYEAAGQAFCRWRASGEPAERRPVDLWAYLYIARYFRARFLTERVATPSDADDLVARALQRVMSNLATVREPERFAAYVSVVCRNVFLSYRQRRRSFAEADDALPDPSGDSRPPPDPGRVRAVLAAAVATLPDATRAVAGLRLLDGLPYDAIAERLGHPLPTVRTYLSKAVRRLRDDPALRELYFDDVLPLRALDDPEGNGASREATGKLAGGVTPRDPEGLSGSSPPPSAP